MTFNGGTISTFSSSGAASLSIANTTIFSEAIVNQGTNLTSLIKTGTGTLIITGTNSNSGTFGVNTGTLILTSTTLNPKLAGISVNSFSGNSTLLLQGGSVLSAGEILSTSIGTSGFSSTVVVSGGSLQISGLTTAGSFTAGTGTTTLNVVNTSDTLAFTGVINNGGTFGGAAAGDPLFKTGNGLLRFSGPQLYNPNASLTVNGGTAEFDTDAGNGLSGTLGLTLASNAYFNARSARICERSPRRARRISLPVPQPSAAASPVPANRARFDRCAGVIQQLSRAWLLVRPDERHGEHRFGDVLTGTGSLLVSSGEIVNVAKNLSPAAIASNGSISIAGGTSIVGALTGTGSLGIGTTATATFPTGLTQSALLSNGTANLTGGAKCRWTHQWHRFAGPHRRSQSYGQLCPSGGAVDPPALSQSLTMTPSQPAERRRIPAPSQRSRSTPPARSTSPTTA